MRLVALLFSLFLAVGAVFARDAAQAGSIAVADLPVEAQQTLKLIRSGGPFPYKQDGVVFGNREKQLPQRPRGYYREYTIKTPGSRDRGARRIVAGAGHSGNVRTSDEFWYSDDHYNSFRRIAELKGK